MRAVSPGEVWMADLGLAAKVRPVLLLTGNPALDDLDLVTAVLHTTSLAVWPPAAAPIWPSLEGRRPVHPPAAIPVISSSWFAAACPMPWPHGRKEAEETQECKVLRLLRLITAYLQAKLFRLRTPLP